MLFDFTESLRLLIVFVPQLFDSLILLFLIYKILKRNINRSSLIISGFYFTVSIGFLMNIVAVLFAFFQPGEIVAIFYFIATYFIIFSFIFLVIFLLSLLKLRDVFTLKKAFIITLIYGIIWLILLLYPGGLTFTETWAPVYSWQLFFAANIFFTISITLPIIIYSIQLYNKFEADNLKKKLKILLFGIALIIPIIYGVILSNTWHDPLFKTVWGIITIVLLLASALLIYFGIGKEL